MSDENTSKKCGNMKCHTATGGAYGLGLIGAAIYFLQQADSFGAGAIGILKAIVWPAMLVYQVFAYFQL